MILPNTLEVVAMLLVSYQPWLGRVGLAETLLEAVSAILTVASVYTSAEKSTIWPVFVDDGFAESNGSNAYWRHLVKRGNYICEFPQRVKSVPLLSYNSSRILVIHLWRRKRK